MSARSRPRFEAPVPAAMMPIPDGMRRALQVARRGAGSVSPNPMVGASLEIPGEPLLTACHARFGGPHAEAVLLERAAPRGHLPRGSILYVTLEPCCHTGKTPPCVDRVIAARPARVIVATLDPDPRVAGRGLELLRKAGLKVEVGCGRDVALADNLAFHLQNRLGRAMVTLKLGSTLDARLALGPGSSRWITGLPARRRVHQERARCDAVLVGSGTVRRDAPELTVRQARGADPSRIVVDSGLRIPVRGSLWKAWRERGASIAGGERVEVVGNWTRLGGARAHRWVRSPRLIVATLAGVDASRRERFRKAGWEVWDLPARRGRVGLPELLQRAAREGFSDLLAEAGPTLTGALLAHDLVDRMSLYLAARVGGGRSVWPPVDVAGLPGDGLGFVLTGRKMLGEDLWLGLQRANRLELARSGRGPVPGKTQGCSRG